MLAIAASCTLLMISACGGEDQTQAYDSQAAALGERVAQIASTSLEFDSDDERYALLVEDRVSDQARMDSDLSLYSDPLESGGLSIATDSFLVAAAPNVSAASSMNATSGHEKPRIAALMLGGLWTPERRQAAARHKFVITSLPYGSATTGQSWINEIRAVNPSIKLAAYSNAVEADLTPEVKRSTYEIDLAVIANNWWLYTAAGARVQWTTAYDSHVVNLTRWGATDASGRRFTEWLGDYVAASRAKYVGLDYVYLDNVWYTPRPYKGNFDFKRTGTDQYAMSPEIQAAWRQGTVDVISRLRERLPGVKVIGNADNDLNFPEYQGKLDGSFFECAFGKSWSILNRLGWARMMAEYRSQLANTSSKRDTVMQGCALNGVDLPMLRFGLASALLEDGWFAYTVSGETAPFWADEYGAELGSPAEPPPIAPSTSGIWLRKYTNGMVLVNPGTSAASINVGAGYRRLSGTQDTAVNNGMPISTVTLEPRRGLVLIKQ